MIFTSYFVYKLRLKISKEYVVVMSFGGLPLERQNAPKGVSHNLRWAFTFFCTFVRAYPLALNLK